MVSRKAAKIAKKGEGKPAKSFVGALSPQANAHMERKGHTGAGCARLLAQKRTYICNWHVGKIIAAMDRS